MLAFHGERGMGHSDVISRLSAAVNGECPSPFEKALCPLSPDLSQDSGWEHLHYSVPGCKPSVCTTLGASAWGICPPWRPVTGPPPFPGCWSAS